MSAIDALLVWREGAALRAVAIRGGRADDALLAAGGAFAPGAIHRARVAQLRPEIGLGFATLDGGTAAFNLARAAPRSGDAVTLQIVEGERADKERRASLRVALPGRYAVAVLGGSGIGWSRALPEAARAALAERVRGAPGAGIVVRSAACDAPPDAVAAEAMALAADLRALADPGDAPRCLLPADPARPVLLEFARFAPARVVAADRALAHALRRAAVHGLAEFAARIEVADEGEALPDRHGVAEALAAGTTLPLDGGALHIEPTRALVAVDIDTGAARDPAALAQAALRELARQLRLRDLRGRVLVDVPGARTGLLRSLERAAACDRATVRVAGFTPTGLIELTRGRRPPDEG